MHVLAQRVERQDAPGRANRRFLRAGLLLQGEQPGKDRLDLLAVPCAGLLQPFVKDFGIDFDAGEELKSEEHTAELQSLMRNQYAVYCLKKKKNIPTRYLRA